MTKAELKALASAKAGDWKLANAIELSRPAPSPHFPVAFNALGAHVDLANLSRAENIKTSGGRLTGYIYAVGPFGDCPECKGSGELIAHGTRKEFEVECPECDGAGDIGGDWEEASLYCETDLLGEIRRVNGKPLADYYREITGRETPSLN